MEISARIIKINITPFDYFRSAPIHATPQPQTANNRYTTEYKPIIFTQPNINQMNISANNIHATSIHTTEYQPIIDTPNPPIIHAPNPPIIHTIHASLTFQPTQPNQPYNPSPNEHNPAPNVVNPTFTNEPNPASNEPRQINKRNPAPNIVNPTFTSRNHNQRHTSVTVYTPRSHNTLTASPVIDTIPSSLTLQLTATKNSYYDFTNVI
eukprot:UN08038